jgi:hypothetical protein
MAVATGARVGGGHQGTIATGGDAPETPLVHTIPEGATVVLVAYFSAVKMVGHYTALEVHAGYQSQVDISEATGNIKVVRGHENVIQ